MCFISAYIVSVGQLDLHSQKLGEHLANFYLKKSVSEDTCIEMINYSLTEMKEIAKHLVIYAYVFYICIYSSFYS